MRNSDSKDDDDGARAVLDTQVDDMSLLRRYVELGSEEAFNTLVARHLSWVHATCRKGLRDRHMAEDAAQAVFIILARRAATLSPQTRLSGWLFNTARFVIKDAKKQEIRYRRRETIAREMSERRMVPIREAVDGRTQAALDDALATLTERDRLALLMHFYEGLSLVEMAQTLGISKDGAKKRVARALTRLRSRLARNGKGSAAPAIAALALILRARAAEAAPVGLGQSVASAAIVPGTASSVAKWMAHRAMSTVAGASRRLLRALIAVEMTVAVGVISVWSLPGGIGGRTSPVAGTNSQMIARAPANVPSAPPREPVAPIPLLAFANPSEAAPYRSPALDDAPPSKPQSPSPDWPAVAQVKVFNEAKDAWAGQAPVPSAARSATIAPALTSATEVRRATEVPAPLPQTVARAVLGPTSNGEFGFAGPPGGRAAIAEVASSDHPASDPPARPPGERPKPTRPTPGDKPIAPPPVAELPPLGPGRDHGKPRPTKFYEKFWPHRAGGPSGHGGVELALGSDDAERFFGHVRRMFIEASEGDLINRGGGGKRGRGYVRPVAVSGDGAEEDLRLCPEIGGLDDLVRPFAMPLASQGQQAGPLAPPFPPGRTEATVGDPSFVAGGSALPAGDFRQVPEPGGLTVVALVAAALFGRRRSRRNGKD